MLVRKSFRRRRSCAKRVHALIQQPSHARYVLIVLFSSDDRILNKIQPRSKQSSRSQDPTMADGFTLSRSTKKPSTKQYLKKGTGYGGMSETEKIAKRDERIEPTPVRARKQPEAYKERPNLPDTAFRTYVDAVYHILEL